MKRLIGAIASVCALASSASAQQQITTANGTWELYPSQATVYATQVQQPINADGSSNFNAKRGVVPVQFKLGGALGAALLPSIYSNSQTNDDFGYASFRPSGVFTFGQISNLTAVYQFLTGNCHGGSLRWSVRVDGNGNGVNDGYPTDPAIFIYYGALPNFDDCKTANNQSGNNLILMNDARYDTGQFTGGTFYDTYAHAVTLAGGARVLNATLVIDSGWQNAPNGDQLVDLSSATVSTSSFSDTFHPLTGTSATTCDLPPADIQVTKLSGTAFGVVNEVTSIQPGDDDGAFRIVDCKYMYNLDVQSLRGTGNYKVEAIINAAPVAGAATFDLK